MEIRSLVFAFCVFWSVTAAAAAQVDPPDLHPRLYKSPSGEYSLLVEPRERHGAGPSKMELLQNGASRWMLTFDFTFQDAVVSDAGMIGGFCYSYGSTGNFDASDLPGILITKSDAQIVLLDQTGGIIVNEATPRTGVVTGALPGTKASPSLPIFKGILDDEFHKKFIVRIQDDVDGEVWKSYSYEMGKAAGEFRPFESLGKPKEWSPINYEARHVGGTPLTVAVFVPSDPRAQFSKDVQIVAFDGDGKLVWNLELKDDFTSFREQNKKPGIVQPRWIVQIDPPGIFIIRSYAESHRRTFRVETRDGNINIREIKQDPDASRTSELRDEDRYGGKVTDFKEIYLKKLGEVALQKPSRTDEGSIVDAINGPAADVAALRYTSAGYELAFIGRAGNITFKQDLQFVENGRAGRPRFILKIAPRAFAVIVTFENEAREKIFRFDADSHELTPLAEISNDKILYAVARGGGSLLLFSYDRKFITVAPDGKLNIFKTTPPIDVDRLRSMTVCADQMIAVLAGDKKLQIFSRDGILKKEIDYKEKSSGIGENVENVTGVFTAANGSLLIVARNPRAEWIVELDDNYNVKKFPLLHNEHGEEVGFSQFRLIQLSGGEILCHEGSRMHQIRLDGLCTPGFLWPRRFSEETVPADIIINRDGRLFVTWSHLSTVSVFDAAGKYLYRCTPGAAEIPDQYILSKRMPILFDDGSVYFLLQRFSGVPSAVKGRPIPVAMSAGEWKAIHYKNDGSFAGVEKVNLLNLNPTTEIHAASPSAAKWYFDDDRLRFVDTKTGAPVIHRRLPTGQWISATQFGNIAKDGTMSCVLRATRGGAERMYQYSSCIFDAKGALVESVQFPETDIGSARIFHDENGILTMIGGCVYITKRSGDPAGYFNYNGHRHLQTPFFPSIQNNGKELWIRDPNGGDRIPFTRFSLDEAALQKK